MSGKANRHPISMRLFGVQIQRYLTRVCMLVMIGAALSGCEITQNDEIFADIGPQSFVLETVDLQFDERGRIIVPVMVNGQGPFDFILDTASSSTLIFENIRKQLDINFIDERTTFVHGATLSVERPVLPIAEIRIGSLAIYDVESFSLEDLQSVSEKPGGILGLDFLSLYALYIDVTGQRLHFARSGYQAPKSYYVSVPITFDDFGILDFGLPFVPAAIQGHPIAALLDLGAESNITNWAAANAFGVNIRRVLRDRFKFEGVFSSIPITASVRDAEVSVGDRYWSDQSLDIANLAIFETIRRADEPALIVSSAVLRGEDMIIDFPAARLYLRATRGQRKSREQRRCTTTTLDLIVVNCRNTRLDR